MSDKQTLGAPNRQSYDPYARAVDDDEDGMLRMSFIEHLEELRSRILKALGGLGAAFVASIFFVNEIWLVVSEPAANALRDLGYEPDLAQIKPTDYFTTVWVSLPLLAALFVGSPWVSYQAWAFIAPGLYKRERRWATAFVITSAGLFVAGGIFAYFVAFRLGLTFLLSIGKGSNVKPAISLVEYFDLFVNVTLGVGLMFELPVLVFVLTLLRIVTPGFLLRNFRYAVLMIILLAAVITPTQDVVNLTVFAAPMILLYFIGVFAGWFLVLYREGRKGTIRTIWLSALGVLFLAGAAVAVAVLKFGYHFTSRWPFLVR